MSIVTYLQGFQSYLVRTFLLSQFVVFTVQTEVRERRYDRLAFEWVCPRCLLLRKHLCDDYG